jgi:hypothetical protein
LRDVKKIDLLAPCLTLSGNRGIMAEASGKIWAGKGA